MASALTTTRTERPGSVLGDNLGIDAVQQVAVLGSNYPAEYGRTSGGVISVETAKGADAFHGSVYEFLRNSALDARNFFDGPVIPPFKRNQFGGSAGLPIRKGRTFIFGDYEGLRQSLGVTTVNTVPSQAARAPDCSRFFGSLAVSIQLRPHCRNQSVPGGCGSADRKIPLRALFFRCLPTRCNRAATLESSGSPRRRSRSENYFTTRFDHKFSDSDSIYVTYIRDNSTTVAARNFWRIVFRPRLQPPGRHDSRAAHLQPQFAERRRNRSHSRRRHPGQSRSHREPISVRDDRSPVRIRAGRICRGHSEHSRASPASWALRRRKGTSRRAARFIGRRIRAATAWSSLTAFTRSSSAASLSECRTTKSRPAISTDLFRFDSLAQFLTNEPSLFSGTGTPLPLDIGMRANACSAHSSKTTSSCGRR